MLPGAGVDKALAASKMVYVKQTTTPFATDSYDQPASASASPTWHDAQRSIAGADCSMLAASIGAEDCSGGCAAQGMGSCRRGLAAVE